MNILIIGGGNMGLTYARSLVRSQITNINQLAILERSEEKAEELRDVESFTIYTTPEPCLSTADLIIIAVKPQDWKVLAQKLNGKLDQQQLVLSIMAGITMPQLMSDLEHNKVIRAMPNLPAMLSRGMTVFSSSDAITRVELVTVQNLLGTTGKTLYVGKESMLDAATAISGSGPAYVFYFMDALINGALEMGFSNAEAETLVTQTFSGAIEIFMANNLSCEEWMQRVASKGGTTEACLASFNENQLNDKIKVGAQKALARAVELGKK